MGEAEPDQQQDGVGGVANGSECLALPQHAAERGGQYPRASGIDDEYAAAVDRLARLIDEDDRQEQQPGPTCTDSAPHRALAQGSWPDRGIVTATEGGRCGPSAARSGDDQLSRAKYVTDLGAP